MMENNIAYRVEKSLKEYIDRQKILDDLLKQIQKDFGALLNSEHYEDGERDLETIIPEMTRVIENMQQQSFEQIKQLLYRIDMSEQVLFDELQKYEQSEHAGVIAWLIAERELKK